ncbi:MAG TPA: hypothetical protein VGN57_08440 [Pirellulaceae bacterium]|jgi:hypothetical protein|nr:hypothetical protein [Pirellulaceae bacterium]
MSDLHIERHSLAPALERLTVRRGERPATFREVAEGWRSDDAFAESFAQALRGSPFRGFCWECPALRSLTLDRPFECVLSKNDAINDREPDAVSFAEAFELSELPNGMIAGFENLSADAYLLAPLPLSEEANYVHLASFHRTAPADQVRELWRSVGQTLLERAGLQPLWLSTAGGGVAWLHVRFDERPKYYSHKPYARSS